MAWLLVAAVMFAAIGLAIYTETDWEYGEPRHRRRHQALGWLCALSSIVCLILVGSGAAKADESRVFVDPAIPNSALVADRITQRLLPDDELRIVMLPVDTPPTDVVKEGSTTLLAVGNEVHVYTSGWPDQVWLQQKLIRVEAVANTGVDRILAMIREIHAWQAIHPKPVPPPPPAPPEPPINWTPWLIGAVIFGAVDILIFLIARRRRTIARLREAAERPVDIPTLDDYLKGMNT